jgi:HD-GYP domain-containing protein (c-di-GMP phosphodiesterase class II)
MNYFNHSSDSPLRVLTSLSKEILNGRRSFIHMGYEEFLLNEDSLRGWTLVLLRESEYEPLLERKILDQNPEIICGLIIEPGSSGEKVAGQLELFCTVPEPICQPILDALLERALAHSRQNLELKELKIELREESKKLKQLNDIGKSLSSISDPFVLMNLILHKSRELTNADAGSICIVKYNNQDRPIEMAFSYFQNDTLNQNLKVDLSLPVSKRSLAGFVALMGESLNIDDVYEIPSDRDYAFNQNVDKSTGYRTKSMLVHPMIDMESKILGVVQLINKKRLGYEALENGGLNVDSVVAFTSDDVDLIESLTSQAAICLKNTTLIQDIQNLFEGFVNASVTAIEQRDPTTSGHSFRVSLMTCELAKVCSSVSTGKWSGLYYNERELQEIRYASLLHDFGKIGVREQVLVKAKKLYPHEMEMIRSRFEYILKDLETRTLFKKVDLVSRIGYSEAQEHFIALDEELKCAIEGVESIVYFIIQTNEPTILEEGNFKRLLDIAERSYLDPYGQVKSFLVDREVEGLSVRKGSITSDERKEIESHVTHSFTFLSKIPWTTGLKQVPSIAYGHHEWLSGDGYPNQLREDEILPQSKMMAIADIYDALTASDRPYKKAIPVEKAISILKMEMDRDHLDRDLTEMFISKQVFRAAENY